MVTLIDPVPATLPCSCLPVTVLDGQPKLMAHVTVDVGVDDTPTPPPRVDVPLETLLAMTDVPIQAVSSLPLSNNRATGLVVRPTFDPTTVTL
eukprot:CAMPEP_0175882894 /NCGR_PEP_ID=MMETSP0107_2-20121207/43670_1 /TAXON_ID=195067 ORGANISM="Goniomonas pacifica, Strain CCMP1869" /NCGR_SAMPLE_ID=MMETSP0107_2 /ASSEMBLY_ACC=CAM_ASM_000203 /LENGTH=92 /DNA_ID=CAMNT_0017202887 /DNA_START=57 /DNA_END=335 /DNA_ORIENTATION=+